MKIEEHNLDNLQKPQLNIPDVIGSYILDGVEQDYTKEILRGDIAILTMDMIRILLDYMKNNGYDRIWDCGNLIFEKNYPSTF